MKNLSTVMWSVFFAASLGACGDKDLSHDLRGQRFTIESWGCSSVAASLTQDPAVRYYATFSETEMVTSRSTTNGSPVDSYRDIIVYRTENQIEFSTQGLTMTVSDQGNVLILESLQVGQQAQCANAQDRARIVLLKSGSNF